MSRDHDGNGTERKAPAATNTVTTVIHNEATAIQEFGEWSEAADGNYTPQLGAILPTAEVAIGSTSNTGAQHLSGTLDLRKDGTETHRVSFRFDLLVPKTPITVSPTGVTLLQWGVDGVPGTITLTYFPLTGGGANMPPHVLVGAVNGDINRVVTAPIKEVGMFITVFLEYDGTSLTLVCGKAADQFISSTVINPPASPNTLRFGADIQGVYYHDLYIYNQALLDDVDNEATSFPYMLWDASDSGVVAVLPTPTIPNDYFVFLDRGYSAGNAAAQLDVTTAQTIATATLYINDRAVALGFSGGTAAQFATWMTTNNSGVIAFPFDGKTEHVKVTQVGNVLSFKHIRGAVTGQMSFSVRLEGTVAGGGAVSGGSWGKTAPILGKIPQSYALPHTGEPNKGISIMGTTATMSSPKSIQVEYKDDDIRTVGKIIGDVNNRPGAGLALTKLYPTNIFGSYKAPIPGKTLVFGNPNSLSADLPDNSLYSYGLVWERFLQVTPADVTMRYAPRNSSRAGMLFGAFGVDIPLGQTLRGLDICFTATPPGLRGNVIRPTFYDKVTTTTKTVKKKNGGHDGDVETTNEVTTTVTKTELDTIFNYNWGEGAREFPLMLTGSGEYTCLYYLLIATDANATKWQPIPSLGVDAVKVQGANTWKEVQFRAVDINSLLDENGASLLKGARRVYFKMVLAHELSSSTFQGMSYRMQSGPGKK